MKASGRTWMCLAGGAGAFALALLGSCGGAQSSDLLTAHSGDSDDASMGSSSAAEAGQRETGGSNPPGPDSSSSGSSSGVMTTCGADTCANGCCNSNGKCVSGNDDAVCGSNGTACQDCTAAANGGMCSARTCTPGYSSGSSSSSSSAGGCTPATCPRCIIGIPCCTVLDTCICNQFVLT